MAVGVAFALAKAGVVAAIGSVASVVGSSAVIGAFIACGAITLVSFGVSFGWARALRHGGMLEELQLTGVTRHEAAHGLLIDFVMPHLAFSCGLASSALIDSVHYQFALGGISFLALALAPVALLFIAVSPLFGLVMMGAFMLYLRALEMLSRETESMARWLVVPLMFVAMSVGALLAVVPALFQIVALALAMPITLCNGDGAASYLPALADHPLLKDEDAF